MPILAWNCRGLGGFQLIRHLRELRSQKRPRLMCFGGTLLQKGDMKNIQRRLNYQEKDLAVAEGKKRKNVVYEYNVGCIS